MDAPARSTSSLPTCRQRVAGVSPSIRHTLLLRRLALALVLGSELQQLAFSCFKSQAFGIALIVNLVNSLGVAVCRQRAVSRKAIVDLPGEPNVGRSTTNGRRHLLDTFFG